MKSMCCCVIWSKIAVRTAAGRHAVGADAGLRELLAERLGQTDHGRLRCTVRRRIRVAFLAGDGRDVHDAPVVLRLHYRHDGAVAQEHAVHVDVEHALPVVDRILRERDVGTGDPGRAHEHVDATLRRRGGLRDALDRTGVRHVEREGDGIGAQRRLGGGERALVAIPQRDARAARDEPPRHGEADAHRAAGDRRRAARKVDLVHGRCLRLRIDREDSKMHAVERPAGQALHIPRRRSMARSRPHDTRLSQTLFAAVAGPPQGGRLTPPLKCRPQKARHRHHVIHGPDGRLLRTFPTGRTRRARWRAPPRRRSR